jgi:hypothetical protein
MRERTYKLCTKPAFFDDKSRTTTRSDARYLRHPRHMDVPAAEGGERLEKTTLFSMRPSASGRMPESLDETRMPESLK